MDLLKPILVNYFKYFQAMVERGGPLSNEYNELLSKYSELNAFVRDKIVTREDLLVMWKKLGKAFYSKDTVQAFALYKPYGYAGDFEVMDRIYTEWISPDPMLEKWDKFFMHKAPLKQFGIEFHT